MRKSNQKNSTSMAKRDDKRSHYRTSRNYSFKNNKRSNQKAKDKDYGKSENVTNDPSWYTDNNLSGASANLFFTKPFGTKIKLWDDQVWSDVTSNTQNIDSAPGIMALGVVPKFGPSIGLNDAAPLNVTSQAVYSFVRHANSGSRNYDAPDLMTYILSLADCYSVVGYMQRLYATINRYYPENKYFAKSVVNSMNADFDSFAGNMAQFRFYINTVISKLTAFAIPADMDFFKRRADIYTNIYMEDESIKDQLYLFYPLGFYKYTVDSSYDEAYLKFYSFPGTSGFVNFSNLQTYVNDMIQRLLEAEDIGIMSGDILKAYGSNIIKLSYIPEIMLIDPVVHDYNVLYQIRNASFTSTMVTPDLHQDSAKQYLEWDDTMTASSVHGAALRVHKLPLVSNSLHPTADEVMESTRLMFTSSNYESDGTGWINDLVVGTEAISTVTIYCFGAGSLSAVGSVFTTQYTTNTKLLHLFSSFKYHPTIYLITSITSGSGVYDGLFQDLDNVYTLDPETLINLHQTAIMKMLVVPAVAKLQ
jgi:hypothetical protein